MFCPDTHIRQDLGMAWVIVYSTYVPLKAEIRADIKIYAFEADERVILSWNVYFKCSNVRCGSNKEHKWTLKFYMTFYIIKRNTRTNFIGYNSFF